MARCKACFEEIDNENGVCPVCGFSVDSEPEDATSLVPGTKITDRYEIGKVIGHGGFGITYLAWNNVLDTKVAIKEYLPSEFSTRMPGVNTVTAFSGNKKEQFEDGLDKFVEEAKKIAKFQKEEGIVKVFDCIKENDTAYIIMEYLEGETLKDYLEREGTVTEEKAIEMLTPVMESLAAVHGAGILHRDIAPDNIFITKDGKIKLIDFGAARFATTSHSRSLTVIVKPGYSPEEQYRSRGDQGPHTDVYSLAALMYKMVTGITPPDALERRAKIEHEKKDPLKDPHKINKNISIKFQNAVMNAMNVRIEDRTATIADFKAELNSETPVKRRMGQIKKIDFYSWPLWVKFVVPLLVVVFATFAVLLATGVINFKSAYTTSIIIPDEYTMVPNIEGRLTPDAISIIEQTGLQYVVTDAVSSQYLDENIVILQNPKPAQYIRTNSIVSIIISSGDGTIIANTVPFILGRSAEDFIADANTAGFSCDMTEIVEEYSDTIEQGHVIRVTLDDGTEVQYGQTFDTGTHLIVCVSAGPAPFAMPNLYNMTLEDAQALLTENGLVCESVELAVNPNVELGHVIAQSIAAGDEVQRGQGIVLTVSATEEEVNALVEVPSVVGSTSDAAMAAIRGAGFIYNASEEFSDTVPAGRVIRQTPAGGSRQAAGATITVVISAGAQPQAEQYIPAPTTVLETDNQGQIVATTSNAAPNGGANTTDATTAGTTVGNGNGSSEPAGTTTAATTSGVAGTTPAVAATPTPTPVSNPGATPTATPAVTTTPTVTTTPIPTPSAVPTPPNGGDGGADYTISTLTPTPTPVPDFQIMPSNISANAAVSSNWGTGALVNVNYDGVNNSVSYVDIHVEFNQPVELGDVAMGSITVITSAGYGNLATGVTIRVTDFSTGYAMLNVYGGDLYGLTATVTSTGFG